MYKFLTMSFNHLYILLTLYPDKTWNWFAISNNEFNRQNAAIVIQRAFRKHLKRDMSQVIFIQRLWRLKYYRPERYGSYIYDQLFNNIN